jgi:hypothetical protein
MKKLVFILAAAMTLSAAQSFAHDKDKGKKKCGGDCCKKEAKATVKKVAVLKKAA